MGVRAQQVCNEKSEYDNVIKKFKEIGARVRIHEPRQVQRRYIPGHPQTIQTGTFTVDIRSDKKGEFYDIDVSKLVDIDVVNIDINDRHLLLNARIPNVNPHFKPDSIKVLCGHDERHWFSSQVNSKAVTVKTAKDSLKPNEVIDAQKKAGVKSRNWNKRHNKGFARQGEWFFIRDDIIDPDPDLILSKEPLIMAGKRGGSKPHIAQFAYRTGGDNVYIPNVGLNNVTDLPRDEIERVQIGLTANERDELFVRYPSVRSWNWRPMVRNPTLYVRGAIRHPDHATLNLQGWHKVIVNGEIRGDSVVFLD